MTTQDGWAFIVNPVAGGGRGAAVEADLREAMGRHGVQGEVARTRAKGHAAELAADFARRGFPFVAGVGGDGTLGEVAAGVLGTGSAFAAVAAGTGNDFIRILGFPDLFGDAQWSALFAAKTAAMDVGRCNGRPFVNGMGLGFDAQVAYENYHMENGGGAKGGSKAKYTWHIVKNLLVYRERPMRITRGGRTEERRSFLNTIANGRRLAGGLMLTPRAFADDGLLDYCSTDPLSVPQRLKEFMAVQKQTHLQDRVFHYEQLDRVVFEFDGEVPAHLDGELIFSERFAVDVLPGALRAVYDPSGSPYLRG